MPRFVVVVEGSEFRIPFTDGSLAADFYTTRWVTAGDEIEARSLAFEAILEELQREMGTTAHPHGRLEVSKIEQIDDSSPDHGPGSGFTFVSVDEPKRSLLSRIFSRTQFREVHIAKVGSPEDRNET